MNKILLVSNYVFHYRQKVYNYFFEAFEKENYEFHVLSNEYQEVNYDIKFIKHEINFSTKGYIDKIKEIKPSQVIIFLHLKDLVMLPIIAYCKSQHIPVIYWNHGVNLMTPESKVKNMIFHFIHNRCDALITYTPEMKKYFPKKTWDRLFIAYNTLDFSDIDKKSVPKKEETKKKYGITQNKVILYISRLLPHKNVDILLNSFAGMEDIAVVVVGPGANEEQLNKINAHDNLFYLGEKYGEDVYEIYNLGTVFSTPGHIGLAMNEALFWGLPVVLLEGKHAPEIYYMKNGITGYIADGSVDFKNKMLSILHNDKKIGNMSENCLRVFEEEVSIDRMFEGFIEAIIYCEKNKQRKTITTHAPK